MMKVDLLMAGGKTDWLRELLENLLTESNTFFKLFTNIQETFLVFEADMHIRQQLCSLPDVQELPELEKINEIEARIRKLVARLRCG